MTQKKALVITTALIWFASTAFSALKEGTITLRVSQNFSQPLIVENKIASSGLSVMEILKKNTNVETAFGGAFVTAINGLKKSPGCDWFYYVNGIMANVGALQCIPKDGDLIWWDLHEWMDSAIIPALIGAYPQPFVSRGECENPMRIIYTAGMRKKSEDLKTALMKHGARNVRLELISEHKRSDKGARIFLGPFNMLRRCRIVDDLYKNGKKCGLFVDFDHDGIYALDLKRKRRSRFKQAGAILALRLGTSADRPVWFVTGTDSNSAEHAADILLKEPARIKGMAGAVVTDGDVLSVPVIRPANLMEGGLKSPLRDVGAKAKHNNTVGGT